jgi:glutathione S-transferase
MRLYTNPASPFGRKVKVLAHETGLFEQLEVLDEVLTPVAPSDAVSTANPLGKIPCLVTREGMALYDSRVICEYLDGLHGGRPMFPAEGARWRALTLQALGDGIMDAGVATRYETFLRPEALRWPDWVQAQKFKIGRALDRLEGEASGLGDEPDIGLLTIGCALGYLDFRYAADAWRNGRPQLAAWFERFDPRPSMQATRPRQV